MTVDGALIADYAYDANSNRIGVAQAGVGMPSTGCAANLANVSATVDAQDRLLTYGNCTYQYTDNGELSTKTDTASSAVTTYQYDSFSNLRHVSLPDGRAIDYAIDGRNRRIGKTIDGVKVQGLVYMNDLEPAAETDGQGNRIATFIYADRANTPSYLLKAGRVYRVIADHLGSVRLVVDTADGSIAQRLDYDAWGQVLTDTNPGFQPFGFAGGLYDQDTGLVRFGARDYDPEVGRWTGKDRQRFTNNTSNVYGYVANNPINLLDRTGRSQEDAARIEQAFFEITQQMTDEGLRLPSPFLNNFASDYIDDKLLKCGDQTAEMISRLTNRMDNGEIGLDDKWHFEFRDNLDEKPWFVPGHIWGAAVSHNPGDGVIQFDTRAGSFNDPPYAPWVQ